jgi:hypothetical protein
MPTITSVSPTSGPTTGGNSVTITGTGFTGPATVYFGGTATTYTLDSSTQITAIAPSGSGTVQVTVVNSVGVSNGVSYSYGGAPTPTPTLTSLVPSSGPGAGGNSVVLTGTGFTGPTTVYFGGAATTFTLDSSTQITAIAPPGSGTVQVTVVNSSGFSNGLPYTYTP